MPTMATDRDVASADNVEVPSATRIRFLLPWDGFMLGGAQGGTSTSAQVP